LRAIVKVAATGAEEKISYQMPAFFLNGNLVHFAAYQNHIGFYPTPSGIEAFKKELSIYEGAKGSVQFPYKQLGFRVTHRLNGDVYFKLDLL